jgi:putative transposase
MKYQIIYRYRFRFKVSKMCQIMEVSRSGYYAFTGRTESLQARRRRQLTEHVRIIHEQSHKIYGSPRITEELHHQGLAVSRGMVCRIMTECGIKAKTVKKYKATTNSDHDLPVAENLLNREFTATRHNEKWVSDITYIDTDEGWLYLAGLMDLYDGSIVGWSLDKRMKKELVLNALKDACSRRNPPPGLLIHSDRGSQYCSDEYQKELFGRKFVCSMSRRGNCWDNAPMESFWGKLKTEWLFGNRYKTRFDAKRAVFEYIELFYNRRRLNSKIGYLAPLCFGKIA